MPQHPKQLITDSEPLSDRIPAQPMFQLAQDGRTGSLSVPVAVPSLARQITQGVFFLVLALPFGPSIVQSTWPLDIRQSVQVILCVSLEMVKRLRGSAIGTNAPHKCHQPNRTKTNCGK